MAVALGIHLICCHTKHFGGWMGRSYKTLLASEVIYSYPLPCYIFHLTHNSFSM